MARRAVSAWWRSAGRGRRAAAVAGTSALLAAGACEGWEVWDDAFKRTPVCPGSDPNCPYETITSCLGAGCGWSSSDAGSTVTLPGNRLLFAHGDTYLNPHWGAHPLRHPRYIFGTTLAIAPLGDPPSTPPQASAMRFYARSQGGSPKNITTRWVLDDQAYFRPACSGGAGTVWPGDGIVKGSTLWYFTWWVEDFVIKQHVIQKYTGVTSSSTPTGWTCQTVTQPPPQYSVFPPTEAQRTLDPQLLLGVAIVDDPATTDLYIYGTRAPPGGSELNAVLAKATDSTIGTYTSWQFLYKPGTQGCGSSPCFVTNYPDSLSERNNLFFVAEGVAPEFSVDIVTHTEQGPYGSFGGTRAVMVHGGNAPLMDANGEDYTPGPSSHLYTDYLANFREVVIRSSVFMIAFPDPNNGELQNFFGIQGSTARADVLAKPDVWPELTGALDPNVVKGYNAYRNIHSLKGHAEISSAGSITVTYNVWKHWTCGLACEGNELAEATDLLAYSESLAASDSYVSPFRFANFPLSVVYPWCQAHWGSQACEY